MAITFNHTIVHARDQHEAATFFTQIFGLRPPKAYGPFLSVELANGVTLDFLDTGGEPPMQHYAFLMSEAEFDEVFGRLQAQGIPYWSDPGKTRQGEVNCNDGGRGVYFEDPSGHLLEIITRPYGSA